MTDKPENPPAFHHCTPSMTNDEISDALAQLDPNSWEATCNCCGTYYTGVFAEPETETKYNCPKCDYSRNGIGSPAGGMNLILRMDI